MDCYRVPDKFAPTLPTRDWVIHPLGGNPVWTAPVAVVPAILGKLFPVWLRNRNNIRWIIAGSQQYTKIINIIITDNFPRILK